MATFSTYAEVLRPDHTMMKMYRAGIEKRHPGVVLADLLRQTGGAYETTTPLTEKFRGYIREVAELTADDELLRIAELPEVPVSLENCRQLDPQTRVVMFCRLDVSPAEPHDGGGSPRRHPHHAAVRPRSCSSQVSRCPHRGACACGRQALAPHRASCGPPGITHLSARGVRAAGQGPPCPSRPCRTESSCVRA
jgi:hypothetical protein